MIEQLVQLTCEACPLVIRMSLVGEVELAPVVELRPRRLQLAAPGQDERLRQLVLDVVVEAEAHDWLAFGLLEQGKERGDIGDPAEPLLGESDGQVGAGVERLPDVSAAAHPHRLPA